MTDDLISRHEAIEAFEKRFISKDDSVIALTFDGCKKVIDNLPSASRWIPVTTRPMDEEERKYYQEIYAWELTDEEAVTFTSRMPEDGQEIWVCSKWGNVWQDTCVIDEGIGLEGNGDWLDIVAWMPFERPEPWKGADNEAD